MEFGRALGILVMLVACGGGGDNGGTTTGPTTTTTTTAAGSSSGGASQASSGAGADTSGSSAASASTTAAGDGSSEGTTTSGEPTKGDCGSDNLVGCYRGMYLSLYTDHSGQVDFAGETEQHRFILGDTDKEQLVLDFITAHRIESLALYDMGSILDDDALQIALESFMARARDSGVLRIEAIGGTSTTGWDRIGQFHDAHAPFDGFVTEIEFWNGTATLQEFLDTLAYVRALPLVAPSGQPPSLSVYVGWVDQSQVDAMLPLIDRAYVHVYVDTAPAAFAYGQDRFEMYANANEAQGLNVEIWPIFSAEDQAWSAGAETFMGEWLADNGLDAAELALLGDLEASPLAARIEVSGHQYFSYFFLERYLP